MCPYLSGHLLEALEVWQLCSVRKEVKINFAESKSFAHLIFGTEPPKKTAKLRKRSVRSGLDNFSIS